MAVAWGTLFKDTIINQNHFAMKDKQTLILRMDGKKGKGRSACLFFFVGIGL